MSDRTNSVLERVRAASKRRTVGEIEAMAADERHDRRPVSELVSDGDELALAFRLRAVRRS
jgi:hypothetical protein